MRLDEEKLEALRTWGDRLGESASEEHAAIGRAILMLVAEIDRLHIDLWHARMTSREREPVVSDDREPVETAETEGEEAVTASLHSRLQRMLRRTSKAAEPSRMDTESDDNTTSPQAWIAELRRQK
jgi:hypothetical protein